MVDLCTHEQILSLPRYASSPLHVRHARPLPLPYTQYRPGPLKLHLYMYASLLKSFGVTQSAPSR